VNGGIGGGERWTRHYDALRLRRVGNTLL